MYTGLIMASHWIDDWKGEYVCVDPAMEVHKYTGNIGERDKGHTHRWFTTDATASSLDTAKYKKIRISDALSVWHPKRMFSLPGVKRNAQIRMRKICCIQDRSRADNMIEEVVVLINCACIIYPNPSRMPITGINIINLVSMVWSIGRTVNN
jgi:hypothetical protein